MSLLVPHVLPLAFVLDVVSDLGGSLLVVTGVLAGAFRSWAVLVELPSDRIEWMTALGFGAGVFATILSVLVEQAWR
jgi:hypothetical protein